MLERSMRSGTELAREIQVTAWSTGGEQGKLVFLVSTKPSLVQFISLFTTGKIRLSIVQMTHQFKFFTLRFLSRQNVENKFVLTSNFFFRNFNPIRRLRVAKKPSSLTGLWSTNTAWCLYSFWVLFLLYEVQLDNKMQDATKAQEVCVLLSNSRKFAVIFCCMMVLNSKPLWRLV